MAITILYGIVFFCTIGQHADSTTIAVKLDKLVDVFLELLLTRLHAFDFA